MMKVFGYAVVIGIAMALPVGAAQPLLSPGIRELGLSFALDHDGEDTGGSLAVRMGYFVAEGVEVGGMLDAGFRGHHYKRAGLGAFGEYNFDLGASMMPYVGLGLGVARVDARGGGQGHVELQVWGGAKYFVIDYGAVSAELAFFVADDDIYHGGEDAWDWVIRAGMRWFY